MVFNVINSELFVSVPVPTFPKVPVPVCCDIDHTKSDRSDPELTWTVFPLSSVRTNVRNAFSLHYKTFCVHAEDIFTTFLETKNTCCNYLLLL
jgi:hypothetical protein